MTNHHHQRDYAVNFPASGSKEANVFDILKSAFDLRDAMDEALRSPVSPAEEEQAFENLSSLAQSLAPLQPSPVHPVRRHVTDKALGESRLEEVLRQALEIESAAREAMTMLISPEEEAQALSWLLSLAPPINDNRHFSRLSEKARDISRRTQENLSRYLTGLQINQLAIGSRRAVYRTGASIISGFDFSFARQKVSNCIYVLISADWSLGEILSIDESKPSFSAMAPGDYKDIIVEVVSLLGEDAIRYPGDIPLDIELVCTIPEQDSLRPSRKHRLRLKMQRADVFVSLLTDTGLSSLASRELDMHTMKTGYEAKTFVLDGGGATMDAGLSQSYLARLDGQLDTSRFRALKDRLLALRYDTQESIAAARNELLAQMGTEDDLTRWSLLLYLKLYLLALNRGMIARTTVRMDDPMVSVGRIYGMA